VTRVGASECGQRASFNRDRDLAGESHWCSSVVDRRNACGLGDRIDSVEVDDMIRYHAEVTAENWGAQATSPPQDGFAAAEPVGFGCQRKRTFI